MPALMDSAVLLGGDAPGPAAAEALHPLEASSQLLDTAAHTPTASGALDDWQVWIPSRQAFNFDDVAIQRLLAN